MKLIYAAVKITNNSSAFIVLKETCLLLYILHISQVVNGNLDKTSSQDDYKKPVCAARLGFKSTCSKLLEFKENVHALSAAILIYQSADFNSARESRKALDII